MEKRLPQGQRAYRSQDPCFRIAGAKDEHFSFPGVIEPFFPDGGKLVLAPIKQTRRRKEKHTAQPLEKHFPYALRGRGLPAPRWPTERGKGIGPAPFPLTPWEQEKDGGSSFGGNGTKKLREGAPP